MQSKKMTPKPLMLELEERGLTWREAKVTAQNEVRWRALEEDLCSMRNEDD